MRFHILGLAHTVTNENFPSCAFTNKVLKLCSMLYNGNEVFHYGAEGSVVKGQHIDVVSKATQDRVYGEHDWVKGFHPCDNPNDEAYQEFNKNAISEIRKRKKNDDFLLITFGTHQKPIADALKMNFTVESGIGYSGVFAPYKIFESYAWMHWIYGKMDVMHPPWYDAVIPNGYVPHDFPFSDVIPMAQRENYILFMGRLIPDKGLHIVFDLARATQSKLVVAGQGDLDLFDTKGVDLDYRGVVAHPEKVQLMRKARCVITPSIYVGPFEGVAAEAQLCGTPVIATDWGAFAETVEHGRTGYRCRTFSDFLLALRDCQKLNPYGIWKSAMRRYSTDNIRDLYTTYFEKLRDLTSKDGWYTRRFSLPNFKL